jgi:two-component system, NtrC family, response regulator HydG
MKRRIFIVDDDRDHAESIADILAMQGHEVVMVYTGEDAVRRFAEHLFDLTLMDVKLPGMNGVEAFLELRRQQADAQVVMMTGFSVEQHLSQALTNGARGVLRKPFAVADLLRAVDETDVTRKKAEQAA